MLMLAHVVAESADKYFVHDFGARWERYGEHQLL